MLVVNYKLNLLKLSEDSFCRDLEKIDGAIFKDEDGSSQLGQGKEKLQDKERGTEVDIDINICMSVYLYRMTIYT